MGPHGEEAAGLDHGALRRRQRRQHQPRRQQGRDCGAHRHRRRVGCRHRQADQAATRHGDQIHDVRFSPDGSTIASAARDGTARTWDTKTGAPIAVHEQKGGHYVDAVSFSPDGRWVLSAGNGWAEIWNARSGKVQTSINIGPEDAGAFDTFARFSRDGKAIVVSDSDGAPTKMIAVELPAE
jgi:Tol biopolymer transport system component